jgi:hypothetical protein
MRRDEPDSPQLQSRGRDNEDDWTVVYQALMRRARPPLSLLPASCISSALPEPDGAGLGTIGLPPRALEQLARDAGFTRFRMHDFEDPANLYYEIRP